VEGGVRRAVQPVRRATAPKYPTLRVAWRILAATMPLLPASAAYADASVPGEHQPVKPGKPDKETPPPPPGVAPPPNPPDPPHPKGVRAPQKADAPPRLPGK
jgi:hypothetical protein